MSDHNDDTPAAETPAQKALRLKQAALNARSGPPQKGGLQRNKSVTVKSGSNKPWMTR